MQINHQTNPYGMTYQAKGMGKNTTSEDGNFPEISQVEPKYESIFSNGNSPLSSYTVHNMGEFPDASFFEDKFPDNCFTQQSSGVENIIDPDGKIVGYSSPNGYDVWYEYAENSTPENPIMNVRLENKLTKEAWEGTMSINDIDPKNASKVEMLVLSQHLTGNSTSVALATTGLDKPFSKEDFHSYLQRALTEAKEMLDNYSGDSSYYHGLEEIFQHIDEMADKEKDKSDENNYFNQNRMLQEMRLSTDFS